MMSLADQIQQDLKAAMQSRESEKVSALRMIRAEILKKEKEAKAGTKLSDAEVMDLLQTLAKQRREAIDQYKAAGQMERAAAEQEELDLIMRYLPEEVSEGEIRAEVEKVISETGASSARDFGKVMGPLMGRLKKSGKMVDGAKVNAIVKERLEKAS